VEQEWHNKDGKYVDLHPLNVAAESHTEVAVVGGVKVYNGIWQGGIFFRQCLIHCTSRPIF